MSKVEIILLILSITSLVGILYLIFKFKTFNNASSGEGKENSAMLNYQERLSRNMTDSVLSAIKHYNQSVLDQLSIISTSTKDNIKDIVEKQDKLLKENVEVLEKTSNVLAVGLEKMQRDNAEKLEKMRETVDEKLNNSLQKRFNESFKLITDRLQEVYKGLGEMKNLAVGVGDLKKVLTNVKTRGVWGEVQLGNLLSQILAPTQFEANVKVKEHSQERVDYVIKIPSKDGSEVMLPIDAKFPIEDYQRLVAAYENADKSEIEGQTKSLVRRVKDEAKKIKEKYILPPNTTDFAVMYFPIEGLYAEITKQPGLIEQLQRDYKINVNGPNTLSAMLNSLQLGFRTMTIEKRSTEIWALLGTFKYEFTNFIDLLSKTQKKLDEASRTIEDATRKSRTIQSKLRHVSTEEGLIEEQNEVLEIDEVEGE